MSQYVARATGVAMMPDGKRFISVSNDGTARLWRVTDGDATLDGGDTIFRADGAAVDKVAVLPDGVHFVGQPAAACERVRRARLQIEHLGARSCGRAAAQQCILDPRHAQVPSHRHDRAQGPAAPW